MLSTTSSRIHYRGGAFLAILAVCGAGMAAYWHWLSHRPDFLYLPSEAGAQWIRFDRPAELHAWSGDADQVAEYRRGFTISTVPAEAPLTVRFFRRGAVFLNGRLLARRDDIAAWKKPVAVDLAPYLSAGRHTLTLSVANHRAPPAVWARCSALQLVTDDQWQVRRVWPVEGGARATPRSGARPAAPPPKPALAEQFPTTAQALRQAAPFLAFLFLLGAVGAGFAGRFPRVFTPALVRWAVMGLWVVLAVNNIARIPLGVGMDVAAHYEYIRILVEERRLPLPGDGWQTFQAPLFYLLAAPLWMLLDGPLDAPAAAKALRVIPLICGALQTELAYRAGRAVFPERPRAQAAAIVVGGLMPMNLYISQAAGNEPLSGLLSGAVLAGAAAAAVRFGHPLRMRVAALLGLALGLALLAKATAVLLIPVVFGAVLWAAWRNAPHMNGALRRGATRLALLLVIAAAVGGWFYVRTWWHTGAFFVGGWDPARGIVWWQDPGYRTPGQLFSFGHALVRPVLASSVSFWDGLYASMWLDAGLSGAAGADALPPWNIPFMVAGAALGLIPSLGILGGILLAVFRRRSTTRPALLLCGGAVVLVVAVMFHHFALVPFPSSVKATYMCGLIPAFALLAAAAADAMPRRFFVDMLLGGALAAWAGAAYAAYFVW